MKRIKKPNQVYSLMDASFYKKLDDGRKRIQKKLYGQNITMIQYTRMLSKKKIKFPKLDLKLFKNEKKKRRY